MSLSTRLAPSPANRRAVAAPIPEAAPVITAILPQNLPFISYSPWILGAYCGARWASNFLKNSTGDNGGNRGDGKTALFPPFPPVPGGKSYNRAHHGVESQTQNVHNRAHESERYGWAPPGSDRDWWRGHHRVGGEGSGPADARPLDR